MDIRQLVLAESNPLSMAKSLSASDIAEQPIVGYPAIASASDYRQSYTFSELTV